MILAWEAGAGRSEFKANLVYRTSSSIARVTQRNPVLNITSKKNFQEITYPSTRAFHLKVSGNSACPMWLMYT